MCDGENRKTEYSLCETVERKKKESKRTEESELSRELVTKEESCV